MINFLLSSISYLLLQSKLQVGLDGYWQVSSQVVEHRVVFEEHAHLFTTSVRHPQESYHILDNRTNELKTFVIDAEKGVAAVCGLFQSAAAFSSSTATGRNDDIKLDIAVEERLHLQEQAQRLVDSYSIDTWTMDHIPLLVNISSSCVVMSLGRSRPHSMWMIADIAGTTPIWYGIHEHHPLTQQSTVVISTDYLVLPQYGVRYPSVTAPGSVFGIQLVVDGRSKSIYEINPIRQKDGYHGRTAVRDSQIDVQYVTGQDFSQVKEEVFHKYYHLLWREAQLVGQQVVHSIPQLPEGHLVLTETDQDYMSSWMLYAVLDKLNVSRLVRFAPPLVIQPDEAQLPKELVELAGKKHLLYHSHF